MSKVNLTMNENLLFGSIVYDDWNQEAATKTKKKFEVYWLDSFLVELFVSIFLFQLPFPLSNGVSGWTLSTTGAHHGAQLVPQHLAHFRHTIFPHYAWHPCTRHCLCTIMYPCLFMQTWFVTLFNMFYIWFCRQGRLQNIFLGRGVNF